MSDTRHKDGNWTIKQNADGTVPWNGAQTAVLMDIRDELKKLNGLLHCSNFTAIPGKLDAIRRNTAKPKRKRTP